MSVLCGEHHATVPTQRPLLLQPCFTVCFPCSLPAPVRRGSVRWKRFTHRFAPQCVQQTSLKLYSSRNCEFAGAFVGMVKTLFARRVVALNVFVCTFLTRCRPARRDLRPRRWCSAVVGNKVCSNKNKRTTKKCLKELLKMMKCADCLLSFAGREGRHGADRCCRTPRCRGEFIPVVYVGTRHCVWCLNALC